MNIYGVMSIKSSFSRNLNRLYRSHAGRYIISVTCHNRLTGERNGLSPLLGQMILGQYIVASNWYIQEDDQCGTLVQYVMIRCTP
jgi:hypothetical protein